ncbi:unnamed protein product, partial [Rotaria magnacalcarata]
RLHDHFFLNACGRTEKSFLLRLNAFLNILVCLGIDGSNQTTFTYGLRNTVGLAFHPITNDLYVTCQERDELGDDLVPDYFTRIQEHGFYGWPFAYMSSNLTDPRRRLSNGTSERPDLVSLTQTPDILFQAHSAVLDMRFYTGNQFPSRYKNGAFAAFHGSWNRNNGTGYKIVFIPFNSNTYRPIGYYEDFVYGFLTNPSGPDTFGRPVGILVMKDGSLLFSDDGNNATTAARNICAALGEGAVAVRMCRDWFKRFREGDMSLEDRPKSGRPLESDIQ